MAGRAQPQPVVMKGHLVDWLAVFAEGVKIRMAEPAPVAKFNAELEGRLGFAHDIVFVDTEQGIEGANRRNGRFADAHRADLGRFDDGDLAVAILQYSREGRGGHPAGRAAADNHDAADAVIRGHGPRDTLRAAAPLRPRDESQRESAADWLAHPQRHADQPGCRSVPAISPDP